MNSHDERGITPVDAQGNNASSSVPNSSSTSTIKIDSLCIKLGFVKEKNDAETCRHFSIRGYVSGMRERGSSNLLPSVEELPPMEVPHFRYWLCQSCLRNCGNENTSHDKTPVVSMCDQSMIRLCAKSFPPQICGGKSVLPFGEGTSGLKRVDNTNGDDNDDDSDDDERELPALRVNESQPSQEIRAVPQQPIAFCSSATTNFTSKAIAGPLDEDPQQDSVVIKDTITDIVGPTIQSSQQSDHPNGNTKRKTRKVRLLKELLGGNNEIQQRKKESSAVCSDPEPSSPLPAGSLIKRKVPHPHPHDQDQRSVDLTTPVNSLKKAKTFKGNNAVAKSTMVEHSKASGVNENDKKYLWNKHGTHNNVSSDPVTAWRSIFSDVAAKTDNHATTATGACKPTYDMSKDRGSTGPRSNLMAPPQPEKKFNFSKKMSKNPLKSKPFGDDSRSGNVRPKDRHSEREIGLDLSLNYDPQSQIRSMSSTLNQNHHPPIQDYSRMKGDFFMGESSSIPHRIPPKEVHDVSNRHAPRPVLFQEQRISYGSCSGHQKLDFSDPHKWNNNGVRGYSDNHHHHHHQRQQQQGSKMVSMGRSDEREIVELLARNQYERSLSEARSGGSFQNINMQEQQRMMTSSSHQDYDYLHMIRPDKSTTNLGRNHGSGFFHQEQQQQVLDFNMFDNGFQQSRNQQPGGNGNGIWMSDSGVQRHHNNSHYHHHVPLPKPNKKMTNNSHLYTPTNLQVLEAFNKYNNGRHQNETDVFSNFHNSMPPHGYAKCSDKDNNQKSIMELDLNVVAPNVIEEQNSFEFMTSSSSSSKEYHPHHHHPKTIHSLDSSYPNEAIPAMQLLSLMDAGKSTHPVNTTTDERKFSSKPISPCYNTHCNSNITGKPKPGSNFQFPSSRYFQSSSLGVVSSSSFPCGFQSGQHAKLTSGQVYYKPQEEKLSRGMSGSHGYRPEDSYVYPVPWKHVNEDRVAVGPRIETEICTINKNPADFSTPGPDNVYMIDVEDLVFRGKKENGNGQKRQKRS